MKKLYNMIFPIWLLFLFPPVVLITLIGNFIIDSLVLLLSLKIFKVENIIQNYKKYILKVYIIGFAVDILGSFLLLIPSFFNTSNNFISALMLNPFKNIYALLYVIIIILFCAYLIYLFNKNITFKNNLKGFKISIIIALITSPYLFMLPTDLFLKNNYKTYEYVNIEKVDIIENNINISPINKNYQQFIIDKNDETYGLIIYLKSDNIKYYELEETAAILMNFTEEVEFVKYVTLNNTYIFTLEDLNKIFGDLKKGIVDIVQKYKNDERYEEYEYLGYIKGYYVFDKISLCLDEKQFIYEDEDNRYYAFCSSLDNIYLEGNKSYLIKEAIDKNIINIEDLNKINIRIVKESKNENTD